jgi:exodeoxyribonuclease V gamma subunit
METKGSSEPEWAALEYSPVENSQEVLEKLLEKYWAGLIRPLHFFPQSSLEYTQHLLKDGNSIDALFKARNKWRGDHFNWGECEEDYYQLCFRNTDPLDSEFQDISEEVFVTLLRNEKRIG